MYSKEEHENLLKEIAETGGDTANMLELLQKLRDDFDEREGELRRYGEERDANPPDTKDEEERIVEESTRDNAEDNGIRRDPVLDDMVPKSDYEDLRRKYIERFFSNPDEAKEEQKEDVKDDGEAKSFDQLFEKKEG